MIDLYLFSTALFCAVAFLGVWIRYKDPLHPFVISCPLLFAAYVWMPYVATTDDNVLYLVPLPQMATVMLVNLCFVSAYLAGCAIQTTKLRSRNQIMPMGFQVEFFGQYRRKVEAMVAFLAIYAQIGYWTGIFNVGGFLRAYSRAKGGGRASSGYLGEGSLAAYPAFLLFAISRRGKKNSIVDLLIGLIIISPNLLHSFFGGRRGPMFITLMIIVFGVLLARARRPSLGAITMTLGAAMLLMVFVGSQRRNIYIGSGGGFESGKISSYFQEERGSKGGTFATSAGAILTCMRTGKYHWGRRYLVTYFIRPIPRALFRDKDAIYKWGTSGGVDAKEWSQTMGWKPQEGYATGFVADLFAELSWGGVLAAFIYGALHGLVWRLARSRGGVWLIELGLLLSLLIYVPSQSVSAFLHRFLFMAVITWAVWRLFLGRDWDAWLADARPEPVQPKEAFILDTRVELSEIEKRMIEAESKGDKQ